MKVFLERKYQKNIATSRSFKGQYSLLCITGLLLISFLSAQKLSAQDLRYSQWHAAQTTVNPAFAGAFGRPRIILNFRDQWPMMPQSYVSYRAAMDAYVPKIRSGLGVTIDQDNQGDNLLQSTRFDMQYMYQARLGAEWALNFGLSLDYRQYRINWQDIQFYDQISLLTGFNDVSGNPNPTAEPAPGKNQVGFVDLGSGLLLYNKSAYLGFSFNHITNPVVSFYGTDNSELPGSVNAQAGVFIGGKREKDLLVNPYALWSHQAGFNQIQTGVYVKKSLLLTGLAVKHNTVGLSDVVLLAGVSQETIRFAYSYDVSTGPLAGLTGGAHEVSLVITLKENAGRAFRNSQKSMLDCPSEL